MKFIHKPVGIIHVGASEMEEAEYYQSLGDPCVLWIEARPLTEANFAKAEQFGHRLKRAALSDVNGLAELHITDNGHSSSLFPIKKHPDIKEVSTLIVDTIRADQLGLFTLVYDTLVLDVQGAELKVLRGFGKQLKAFDWIMSEVFYDEVYENVPLCGEVLDFLKDKGFELVQEEKHHSGLWGDILVKRAKP